MQEVKNNSDTLVHLNRPDLGIKVDLAPGKSVVVSDGQGEVLRALARDLKLTVSPTDKEMTKDVAEFIVDRKAAMDAVANATIIRYASESRPDYAAGDFDRNDPRKLAQLTDAEKLLRVQAEIALKEHEGGDVKVKLEEAVKKLEELNKSENDPELDKKVQEASEKTPIAKATDPKNPEVVDAKTAKK